MQVIQFVARRDLLILGKKYNTDDVIDDPAIPPRVLSSLTNTRKIAQRIVRVEEIAAEVVTDPTVTAEVSEVAPEVVTDPAVAAEVASEVTEVAPEVAPEAPAKAKKA